MNTGMTGRIKKDLLRDIMPSPGDSATDPSPVTRSLGKQLGVPSEVMPLQLWEMHDEVKRLVEQGRLFALYTQENFRQSSKIVIENNKLLLYNLVEESEPIADACYMQFDGVQSLSLPPRTLFLDFQARGSIPGRVWIETKAFEDEQRILLDFLRANNGFIGSPLQVSNKGQLWERIICGRSLTQATNGNWSNYDLTDDQVTLGKTGMVSLLDSKTQPLLISINPGPYKFRHGQELGFVTDGLDMLSNVVHQFDDLREVKICNGGVELSTKYPIGA